MKLPIKLRKTYQDVMAIRKERTAMIAIAVVGLKGAGKSELIKSLGKTRSDVFIEIDGYKLVKSDLTIVVLPSVKELGRETLKFLKKLKKYVVALSKTDKGKKMDSILYGLEKEGINFDKVVPLSAEKNLGIEDLKSKIISNVDVSKIALAYHIPSLSKLVIEDISKSTARQNGLLGSLIFIPGADMPILTANQIRMILEIGSVYGIDLDWQRAKEILAVVGSGFVLRSIARQLLDAIPGPGWAIKGAVAYAGTLAIAKSAELYFNKVCGECKIYGAK